MAHGSGLPGAVVQRSLADWPVVLAAWLLLVCATTLLATGVVYGDAVATGGLHRALLAEPPADRAVVAALNAHKPRIDDLDRVIRPQIERSIAAAGGEVVRVLRSAAFADRTVAVDQVHDLTVFESLDGIEAHARLVAGVWPSAGGEPLQATVSEAAATAMNLSVGDRLALVSRVDPALTVEVVIAGVWRADPADAFWVGDPLETTGSSSGGSFQNRGPLVVREADLV
ncbi:MAG TPA: hypothetical protein VFY18_12530, partial [Candidatus Limnocylindrales bacterium]|nr:hypothetical protein [Candidatus Limnocylindrales bacterium]